MCPGSRVQSVTSLVGKKQAPPGGFLFWDGIKSLVVWKAGIGGLVTLYVLSLLDGPFQESWFTDVLCRGGAENPVQVLWKSNKCP